MEVAEFGGSTGDGETESPSLRCVEVSETSGKKGGGTRPHVSMKNFQNSYEIELNHQFFYSVVKFVS